MLILLFFSLQFEDVKYWRSHQDEGKKDSSTVDRANKEWKENVQTIGSWDSQKNIRFHYKKVERRNIFEFC